MRAAIYARISKDRIGAGLGVDRQESECRNLAERRGWTVGYVFTDNDLSAYSGKPRPGYREMLEAIRGGLVGEVICWHTDRLHRSPVELEEYIEVCQPRDVPTHAVMAGTLDLTTAWGRKDARNRATDARYESEHMSERISSKKLELAQAGKFRGGPRPFGFEADGETIRLAEAAEIAAATRGILSGESVAGTCRRWNSEKVAPPIASRWTPAAVRSVLMRARNAGLIVHRGEVIGPARWEPIVSEAEWRALVRLLGDPSRRPRANTSLRWQGSSLYLCGLCDGATMRSNSVWSPKRKDLVPAYRCREKPHNSILAVPTDEYVNDVIAALLRARAGSLLKSDDSGEVARLHVELAAVTERADELAGLYGAGVVDAREWAAASAAGKARRQEIEARMAELAAGTSLAGVADAPDPGRVFLDLPVERRRAVIGAVAVVKIGPSTGGLKRPGEIDQDRVSITPGSL